MTAALRRWAPARHLRHLTAAQMLVLVREPMATIGTIGFPALTVVVLASVFGRLPDPDFGGVAPSDHYFAGYIGVVIAAMGLITLPTHFASQRELGVTRRFRAAGLTASSVIGSEVVIGALFALAAVVVVLVLGVVLFDLTAPASPGEVVLWALAALACFTTTGLALGTLAKTARAATALGNLLFLPMLLIGGGGPPRAVMSPTMQAVSDALPLTHIIGGLRHAWLGHTDDPRALWWPCAVALVAASIAVRRARRDAR